MARWFRSSRSALHRRSKWFPLYSSHRTRDMPWLRPDNRIARRAPRGRYNLPGSNSWGTHRFPLLHNSKSRGPDSMNQTPLPGCPAGSNSKRDQPPDRSMRRRSRPQCCRNMCIGRMALRHHRSKRRGRGGTLLDQSLTRNSASPADSNRKRFGAGILDKKTRSAPLLRRNRRYSDNIDHGPPGHWCDHRYKYRRGNSIDRNKSPHPNIGDNFRSNPARSSDYLAINRTRRFHHSMTFDSTTDRNLSYTRHNHRAAGPGCNPNSRKDPPLRPNRRQTSIPQRPKR